MRHARRVLELVEAAFEHVLGVETFDAHEVEDHVVPEVERRVESVGLSLDHVLRRRRLELLVRHHDDDSAVVESSPSRSPGHLDVLAGREVAEVLAVELAHGREDDGLGGHVQSDREGLGREEDLDEALLEEDLDDLLEDGEQASVMDSDAALEEGEDVLDLRELAVVVREVRDRVGEHARDHVALLVRVELELGHLEGEPFALALREREDDDGVVVLEHDHLDDLVDIGRAWNPHQISAGKQRKREPPADPCSRRPSSSAPFGDLSHRMRWRDPRPSGS